MDVSLAIIRRADKFLVSLRAPGRVYAGMWEFPGGKVLPSEAPDQAAVREAFEETGLEVDEAAGLGTIAAPDAVMLYLFLFQSSSGNPRANDPGVLEVRWADASELRRLPMPPANSAILDRLDDLLRQEKDRDQITP